MIASSLVAQSAVALPASFKLIHGAESTPEVFVGTPFRCSAPAVLAGSAAVSLAATIGAVAERALRIVADMLKIE